MSEINDLGFVCDSCGRKTQGTTIVKGMKFCAKCYQETFGATKDWQLLDKDKTIEELKQQLAEKDKEIKALKEELEDETDFKNEYYHYWKDTEKDLKEKEEKQRHQICDKIREKLETRIEKYPIICEDENHIIKRCIFIDTINEILEQIERGE